jgi:hypothetical protein
VLACSAVVGIAVLPWLVLLLTGEIIATRSDQAFVASTTINPEIQLRETIRDLVQQPRKSTTQPYITHRLARPARSASARKGGGGKSHLGLDPPWAPFRLEAFFDFLNDLTSAAIIPGMIIKIFYDPNRFDTMTNGGYQLTFYVVYRIDGLERKVKCFVV